MPKGIYSLMVMREKPMVDGEGLSADGGDDGIEVPLPGVQGKIDPRNRDHDGACALVWKDSLLMRLVLGVYKDLDERMRREEARCSRWISWHGQVIWPFHGPPLQPAALMMAYLACWMHLENSKVCSLTMPFLSPVSSEKSKY
jgi:hypothetical protein